MYTNRRIQDAAFSRISPLYPVFCILYADYLRFSEVKMTTGIFYSQIFKTSPGPVIGPKFINFPEALGSVLKLPNVRLFEHEPVSEDLILKFHPEEMVENLRNKPYGKNAFYSVGACVEASKRIMSGELKNGLLFNSTSGHHAGPTRAWGGTYLNCVAPAVRHF